MSLIVFVLFVLFLFSFKPATAEEASDSDPKLIVSPNLINIAPPQQPVTLTCDASAVGEDENITYEWYRASDSATKSGEIIENENQSSLNLSAFTERGLYYYFCKVTNTESNEEFLSDIITVAYTGLPTVVIKTADGINPTTEKEKREGQLIIYYPDGSSYNSDQFSADGKFTVKVRGNATAYYPKAPYKLKLPKKANLLDINSSKNKDKNWVLLANYCDKTLLRTKTGFYIYQLFNDIEDNEQIYVPHSEFVDVILNNEYIGNYNLTDQVKEGSERLAVNEKDNDAGGIGYVAEYDPVYYTGEDKYFESVLKKFPYTFKFPDTDEEKFDSYMANFESYINNFEAALFNQDEEAGDWKDYIDIESFARWFLSHNISANLDTNFFFSKKTSDESSKLIMGPVWDFEWSMGIGWYDGERPRDPAYWTVSHWYFDELLRKEEFISEIKNQWSKLKAKYPDLAQNIQDKMREYASLIDTSQKINFEKWPVLDQKLSVGADPLGSYSAELECDIEFLKSRIAWLDDKITNLNPIIKINVDITGDEIVETTFGTEKISKYAAKVTALYSNNSEKDITDSININWSISSGIPGILFSDGGVLIGETTAAGTYDISLIAKANITEIFTVSGSAEKSIKIQINKSITSEPTETNNVPTTQSQQYQTGGGGGGGGFYQFNGNSQNNVQDNSNGQFNEIKSDFESISAALEFSTLNIATEKGKEKIIDALKKISALKNILEDSFIEVVEILNDSSCQIGDLVDPNDIDENYIPDSEKIAVAFNKIKITEPKVYVFKGRSELPAGSSLYLILIKSDFLANLSAEEINDAVFFDKSGEQITSTTEDNQVFNVAAYIEAGEYIPVVTSDASDTDKIKSENKTEFESESESENGNTSSGGCNVVSSTSFILLLFAFRKKFFTA